MKKHFILFLTFLLSIVMLGSVKVSAEAPYITRTVNRYGEWVETQEAYDPMLMLKTFGEDLTLNSPKDLFIDENDYIYIADTGNKRILILDENYDLITSFGEDKLILPTGIFVRDDYIYITDYGLEEDQNTGCIYVYYFDQETNTVTLEKELNRPTSKILEINQFIFRPQKIAVDQNHTMYIVNEGSSNGILLASSENRFLNYFAPNNVDGTLFDRIRYLLYANNPDVILDKKIPPAPFNVMLDDSGFIYTVTQTVTRNNLGDTVKKVNIGGTNFYPVEMISEEKFVDSWTGKVGNLYVATQSGFIYEYDYEGNLLFVFSGNGYGNDKIGLFSSISALAVNSKGNLLVLDDNRNNIQVFKETNFATQIHSALDLYNNGKYVESLEVWEEVLRYNSMFDLAHKGIGLAKYLDEDYEEALESFYVANAKEQYSDTYWEIRNIWLLENAGLIILAVALIYLILKVIQYTNRKYGYLKPVQKMIQKIKKIKVISEMLFYFHFIKNPADCCYEVKAKKRITVKTSLIMLLILFIIYVLSIQYTGYLFNNFIIERTILFKEALKIIIPIFAFVVANYLISSLMEGEGTFKAIFINTIGALMPIFIMFPFIIVMSNFLTYNEGFLYSFGMTIMLGWSAVMLFAVIKETHNYTVKQTIINFILTALMMIIIIIVTIMVYIMITQVVNFVYDVIKEVMLNA